MFIETFIELWFSDQKYVYTSKDTCNAANSGGVHIMLENT